MGSDSALDSFLAHHGVKGMKWGVVREQAAAGSRRAQKKLAKGDKKWEQHVSSSFPFETHNAAAHRMNGGLIEQFNNRPEFKGKDVSDPASPLAKKYIKDYATLFNKVLNEEAVKNPGNTNASGTKKIKFSVDERDVGMSWKVEDID